jgi:hypothetical protein
MIPPSLMIRIPPTRTPESIKPGVRARLFSLFFFTLTLKGEAVTFSEKTKEERNDFSIYPEKNGECLGGGEPLPQMVTD